MISESVSPSSSKHWSKMLSRHVLDMHQGLEKEKIAPKTPTHVGGESSAQRGEILRVDGDVIEGELLGDFCNHLGVCYADGRDFGEDWGGTDGITGGVALGGGATGEEG